ncbi:alpha/beta fold hydrolase [Candidatus Bathyarchaeota archaeon]|nr:alpha/beta fold hydrolase [Candidatus Bathyarchaeota archaeon]
MSRSVQRLLKPILSISFSLTLVLSILSFTVQTPRRFSNPPTVGDIGFWNISRAVEEPLDIKFYDEETRKGYDHLVKVRWLTYVSEYYGGAEVRINGFIAQPADQTKPLPAILMLHGTNGSSRGFLDQAVYIASRGYVVMAIDAPGCGESSKEPACTVWNIVNVSGGPKGAYYYHAAWSALRAVTVLTSLPEVDPDRIVVAGASMGGLETYMVAAVDPRVKAAIPIVASGNYRDLVMAGSLANLMAPEELDINSEEAELLLKFLDVYFYAAELDKPVFMLVSTNDEFFTLHAINDTFNVIPYPGKLMNLAPNWGHFEAYDGWIAAATLWLDSLFKGGDPIPVPKVSYRIVNWKLEVEANYAEGYTASIVWKSGFPGSMWVRKPMRLEDGRWVGEVEPVLPSKVFFYVAFEREGVQICTSPVYETRLTSLHLPLLLLVVTAISVVYHRRRLFEAVDREHIVGLSGWLLAALGFLGSYIVIPDRTEVMLWDLLERYGLTVGLNPWLTGTLVVLLALHLTLALLKPRLCIIPASISFIALLSILGVIQNLVFKRLTVTLGYGVYLLLTAVIVHAAHLGFEALLSKLKRKRVNVIKR